MTNFRKDTASLPGGKRPQGFLETQERDHITQKTNIRPHWSFSKSELEERKRKCLNSKVRIKNYL